VTSGTVRVTHRHDPPSEPLRAVLSGSLGVEAVRGVALAPWRHGLEVTPTKGARSPGEDLELLRTKFKPHRKLTAYYRRGRPDGTPAEHLAVSWQAGASVADAPRVSVTTSPADPAMPHLSRLTSPSYLAALLARLDPGRGLATARLQVSTIRYRPGQRHVLRVTDPDRGRGFVVKTDRDHSGPRAISAARSLRPMLASHCPGADVVEPLGHSALEWAAVWRLSGGSPLSQLLAGRGDATEGAATVGDATAYVSLAGQAARALHDHGRSALDLTGLALLPEQGLDAEAASTLRAGDHLRVLLPALGRQYDELVTAVSQTVATMPAATPTLLHGDLKSDNLLVEDGRVRLLDLDRVCVGDPAVDLGKFLADLRWWSGDDARAAELAASFRAGYGAGADHRWARAGLLAALFEAKFAARRCAVHDPAWEQRVQDQVERAWASLDSDRRSA
jgi:hypothetical protein